MSSLWTPSGEHRVDDEADAAQVAPQNPVRAEGPMDDLGDAEAQVEALRQRLAEAPAETVLANHCYGLFELGAVYLSADPPLLGEARLAIDALSLDTISHSTPAGARPAARARSMVASVCPARHSTPPVW